MSTDDPEDIPLSEELREKLKKERNPTKVEPGFALEAYTLWVTLKEEAGLEQLKQVIASFDATAKRAYPDPQPEICTLTGEVKELTDYQKSSMRRYIVSCPEEAKKPRIEEHLRTVEVVEAVDLQPVIGVPRHMFEGPNRQL